LPGGRRYAGVRVVEAIASIGRSEEDLVADPEAVDRLHQVGIDLVFGESTELEALRKEELGGDCWSLGGNDDFAFENRLNRLHESCVRSTLR
jgi:hypothetical protein